MNMNIEDYFIGYLNLIKSFIRINKNIKNPYDLILFRSGFKKKIVIKTKNGNKYVIKNISDYKNFWGDLGLNEMGLNITQNKDILSLNWKDKKISFYKQKNNDSTWGAFKDQFIEEQYKYLHVKNRVVVDIGANMGDSAIYFALEGAKMVYGFEPYPLIYDLSIKNIKLNNLVKQITLINKGVGSPSYIHVKEDFISAGGSELKDYKEGRKIEIISLKDVLTRYKIPKHSALKIDCEGSEYEILLNSNNEIFSMFDRVMVEYHYGYKNLVKQLKKYYKNVKYTRPTAIFNVESNKKMYCGLIYASN